MTFCRNVLWAVATFVFASGAQAVDCKMQTLQTQETETASSYLEGYRNECVVSELAAIKKKWQIDSKASGEYPKLVPAWMEMADTLGRLADSAPTAAAMRLVYRAFSERARAAANGLKADLESGMVVRTFLYRSNAWDEALMVLPPLRDAGNHDYAQTIDVGSMANRDCQALDSSVCKEAILHGKTLMLYWRLAEDLSENVSDAAVKAVAFQVSAKEELWNRYLYDSKPMLPLDFFATDLFEQRKDDPYKDGVPSPPRRQWFLMHPAFGVEYASAATDGQEMKPILYLELIGVNYWNKDQRPFDVPLLKYFSGASLTVSYSDRAGLKDTGFGVLLTFDNVYSIGISRYGSNTGFSLSLDLANLFRDKLKPQYEAWKNVKRVQSAGERQ